METLTIISHELIKDSFIFSGFTHYTVEISTKFLQHAKFAQKKYHFILTCKLKNEDKKLNEQIKIVDNKIYNKEEQKQVFIKASISTSPLFFPSWPLSNRRN